MGVSSTGHLFLLKLTDYYYYYDLFSIYKNRNVVLATKKTYIMNYILWNKTFKSSRTKMTKIEIEVKIKIE